MSEGMPCPHCSYPNSRVKDSRPSGDQIRRRRICLKCRKRWTTFEAIGNGVDETYAMNEMAKRFFGLEARDRDIIESIMDVMERLEKPVEYRWRNATRTAVQ